MFTRYFTYCVCLFVNIYAFEYPQPFSGYYSQHGQDKYLAEEIFPFKQNGVFVEIGAHDGVSFSNTYYFEKHMGWTGICVEPIREMFDQLTVNRSCICENVCIDVKEGKKTFVRCFGYITEMYSGLEEYYDARHTLRIDKEIEMYGGGKIVVEVDCTTISKLLERYNIRKIDLLSVDIEGGEGRILNSIDFDQVEIKAILVENNFNEQAIRDFLLSKNYSLIKKIGKDDVFIKNAKI